MREANEEAVIPIGAAAALAGLLLLIHELFLHPAESAGSSSWREYVLLFSFLLAFGALLLILHPLPRVRPFLPVAAAVFISLLTAALAATDSLVSRDMSALAIGLVGGTIALRSRMPLHLLRGIATVALYIGGVRLLAARFPDFSDLVNSFVQLILAMLVAFILERYAYRAYLYQAKLEARNRELHETAIRDRLTGLYNRHYTDETLDRSLDFARSRGKPFSLILLDVDHFKKINDEFGHDEGDRVLVAVACALALAVRTSDTLGRFGGDEFIVILPDAALAVARFVAGRILETVGALGPDKVPHPVTVSAGIVELRPDEERTQLFHRVDDLLYTAKRNGRNCCEY
jgi:diguanylate cyclase (GGDEF)-like protein